MTEVGAAQNCSLDDAILSRFGEGESSAAERRKVLKHLFSGCPTCRAALAPKIRLMQDHRSTELSISRVLASVATIEAQLQAERLSAADQFREFRRHPTARQWTLLRNSARFDTWAFAELILDEGLEAIYDDPHRSLELCRMGVTVAERLSTALGGDRVLEDLRARAWGRTANSLRATSDLAAAEQALATAKGHLLRGSGEPLEEAEHLYFTSSLRRAQRRLDEALQAIHRSRRIYRMVGSTHLEGRSILSEAIVQDLVGDTTEAISLLRQALVQLDPAIDRRLAFVARHNLAWQLMNSGRAVEAKQELEAIRPLYLEFNDRMVLLRLRWMEARLAKDLGQPGESEIAFREAHYGFVAARIPYEAASVALDLATLFAEQGRTQELKVLAAELVEVFRNLGVAREAFVASTILESFAQAEALTIALIARFNRYFSQVRSQPDLRFDPNGN